MNCQDMLKIPELDEVLILRAGENGTDHPIRWIYFADCLQCIKTEYRVEDYIHGSEFVVLTNRSLTDDNDKLRELIGKMQERDIAALGINEGQISEELIDYCNEQSLPLFELAERFPLVDLSQIMCQRLVMEEKNNNSAEQLFSSILDAEHLNKEYVYAQARFLNVNLSGEFQVIQFAYHKDKQNYEEEDTELDNAKSNSFMEYDDFLTLGKSISRIIHAEFSHLLSENILTQLQTGAILALVPSGKLTDEILRNILNNIIDVTKNKYNTNLYIGIGNSTGYLEDVKLSRNEASAAIKVADLSNTDEHVFFYKDQGLYTLISKITDQKFLDEFVEKHIGRLIRADEVNDSNLCETLENYLNNNCNAKLTAEFMYLHRNTLNYRLEKIQKILGKEFNDMECCLTLKLAFMIRNYRAVHRAQKI